MKKRTTEGKWNKAHKVLDTIEKEIRASADSGTSLVVLQRVNDEIDKIVVDKLTEAGYRVGYIMGTGITVSW